MKFSGVTAGVIMGFAAGLVAIAAWQAESKSSVAAPTPAAAVSHAAKNKFGMPGARPRSPGAIRIATYNMLNLFDDVDDPSLQGEFDDIQFTTSDDRCKSMAAAIRELNADIIALQEVESLDALRWFRDRYLKDMGYKYMASEDVGYYRGVEQSVLSRFEIVETKTWPNENLLRVKREGLGWASVPRDIRSLKFQRSPLMVRVKVNADYELTVFAVHHKAGREFDYAREAEALRLSEIVAQMRREDPNRNIAVMGDFNAAPWFKSVRVYYEVGLIDSMGYRGSQGDEGNLFKTHESDRILDLILMSPGLYNECVHGSGFVLGTLMPPSSYDYRKDTPPAGYASDHYPVAIDVLPRDVR